MALVKAYKGLTNPVEQQAELAELTKSLSFSHARRVTQLLHSDNFRYDIVGRLPPELYQHIFQHLPLYQIFKCRRVSRRWQEILSSDRVTKQGLGQWCPADHASSDVPLTEVARRVDAYQQGKPFSMMIFKDIKYNSQEKYTTHVSYADAILAWIGCEDSRSVEILDIRSEHRKHLFTPNRDELFQIANSSTIAAVLSKSAKCYIWRLDDGTLLRTVQFDSASFQTLLIVKSTFALLNASVEGTLATGE